MESAAHELNKVKGMQEYKPSGSSQQEEVDSELSQG
jgi:hypothetical protein